MATLQVFRTSEYVNRFRNIRIYLNDKKIDVIANGETSTLNISEGSYTLQAKIDWCKSNKIFFKIDENETKQFDLSSFAKHNPLGIFASIYYVSFGAGKYLNLTERHSGKLK